MEVDIDKLPPEMRLFFEQGRAGLLEPLPGSDPTFQQLGFDSYDAYLASRLWQKIRRRVLRRDGKKCRRCSGRANSVHHLSYAIAVLRGDADHLLASLCDGCHDFIERDEHGNRRTIEDRDRLLTVHEADNFPVPVPVKISARKKIIPPPAQWGRMSYMQRLGWFKKAMSMCDRYTHVQIGPRYSNL